MTEITSIQAIKTKGDLFFRNGRDHCIGANRQKTVSHYIIEPRRQLLQIRKLASGQELSGLDDKFENEMRS